MAILGLEERVIASHEFAFRVYFKPAANNEGYLVCHHGIGSSAHTFALFIAELLARNPDLGVVLYDARHHGYTEPVTPSKNELSIDLTPQTLLSDLSFVLKTVLPSNTPNRVLLLGHSLGGAVMARFANAQPKPLNLEFRGLVVVDAVEGYAKQSLSSMHSLLSLWPKQFRSNEEAIQWHLQRGHLLRNPQSAAISVPPLLVLNPRTQMLTWKLDLARTSAHWDSWFADLDEMFLKAPCAKLLALAGIGRLDTSLTRGQMQGKFQLVLITEAGHYIHEDAPQKMAIAIAEFWLRNGKPITIVPKFGQLRP